mmetsp:Transcript_46685/g.117476  ORF Transcript_46685/g.117476 Transcript_46685/m.117476 type:complete len:215 (-) Transcript_46685:274-918(-)
MPVFNPLGSSAANIMFMDQIAKESELRFKSKATIGRPRVGPRTALSKTGFTVLGYITNDEDSAVPRPMVAPHFPTPRFPHRHASMPALPGADPTPSGFDSSPHGGCSPAGSAASSPKARSGGSSGRGSTGRRQGRSLSLDLAQDGCPTSALSPSGSSRAAVAAAATPPGAAIVSPAAARHRGKPSEGRREHLKAMLAAANGWNVASPAHAAGSP